ncbi:MAG: hypothetical protein AVDCRST_MAG90-283, partial [uncultured Microvirga sp.]
DPRDDAPGASCARGFDDGRRRFFVGGDQRSGPAAAGRRSGLWRLSKHETPRTGRKAGRCAPRHPVRGGRGRRRAPLVQHVSRTPRPAGRGGRGAHRGRGGLVHL